MMLQKNEERIGTVISLGMDGEGIIKAENTTIFIPHALTGEKIRYKVLKTTSNCAYGKVLEVLTPAEERVRPICPVFGKCGGCHLQHVRYKEQLKIKENKIKVCFKKIANLDVEVLPTEKSINEYRYRNKLQLPVCEGDNGGFKIGFYAENSHRIVEISDCYINPEWTKDIISAFSEYFTNFNIVGYNESLNCGDVREITVKEVDTNLIITLVALKSNLNGITELPDIISKYIKNNFSLFININNNKTNVVYGDEFINIYGEKEYSAKMRNIKYKIGVQSFMQVNTYICEKLYSAVIEAVNADENTTVIDAYSGAGLMTAMLAVNAKKAIGIEIIPEAVSLANDLAIKNKLSEKISNYQGKCEIILPDIIKKEKGNGAKISLVLDPPRKGCDIKVIEAILESDIDKIVYVSCKPSTLARDVGLLTGSLTVVDGEIKRVENPRLKYKVNMLKPFDMFSETKHVETLCVLEKQY